MCGLDESKLFKAYQRKHFLIVDDIENFRMSMKKMMLSFGVEKVDTVKNGKEAISACKEVKYDVILCDYNLGPGKNGQQVLEELRYLKHLKHTDIFIIITAESSKEMVMAAVENQPDGYLAKPFSQAALKQRLDKIVDQKEALLAINRALDQEDYPTAISLCAQEIRKKSKYRTWCIRIMANLNYLEGNFDLARQLYTEAQVEKELVWASLGLAKIMLAEKNYDAAEATCQQVIVNDSQNLAAHELLADIYEQQGELKKAQQSLEVAVAISPLNILRQKKLGEVCVNNLNIERATDAYRRTVGLGEHSCHDSPDAHLDFSRCLTDLCDADKSPHGKALFKEAMGVLKQVNNKYGDSNEVKIQSLLVETRALSGQDYKEEALKVLEEAQTLCESNAELLSQDTSLELAKSLYSVDQGEEAQQVLNNLAQDYQGDKQVQMAVTDMLEDSFNYKKKVRARNLNKRGIELAEKGDFSDAITTFESALIETPKHPGLNLNLVQTLLKVFHQAPPSIEDIELCRLCIQRVKHINEDHKQYKRFMNLMKKVNKLTSTSPEASP